MLSIGNDNPPQLDTSFESFLTLPYCPYITARAWVSVSGAVLLKSSKMDSYWICLPMSLAEVWNNQAGNKSRKQQTKERGKSVCVWERKRGNSSWCWLKMNSINKIIGHTTFLGFCRVQLQLRGLVVLRWVVNVCMCVENNFHQAVLTTQAC